MRATKLIKDADRFETASFHWSREPGIAKDLEDGDWFVQVIKCKDQSTLVYPPSQFRSLDVYGRGNGKNDGSFISRSPNAVRAWNGRCFTSGRSLHWVARPCRLERNRSGTFGQRIPSCRCGRQQGVFLASEALSVARASLRAARHCGGRCFSCESPATEAGERRRSQHPGSSPESPISAKLFHSVDAAS